MYRFINRPDLAISQSEMESACHCSRAYSAQFQVYLAAYGDHGADVSGCGRDHFPIEAKDHMRRIAAAVSYHSQRAYAARPARVRHATILRLGQEIATRDGTGFYGPQALRKES